MRSTAEREDTSCTRQPIIAPPPSTKPSALFAKGSEAKYLAGGHTLIPVMKQRLAAPSDVIDLGKIKELVGIEVVGRHADHQGGHDLFRHHAKR